jgi:hypothetical protein
MSGVHYRNVHTSVIAENLENMKTFNKKMQFGMSGYRYFIFYITNHTNIHRLERRYIDQAL